MGWPKSDQPSEPLQLTQMRSHKQCKTCETPQDVLDNQPTVEPPRRVWAHNQERHGEVNEGMDDALGGEQGSGMKAPSLLKVEQRRGWMEGLVNGGSEERKANLEVRVL